MKKILYILTLFANIALAQTPVSPVQLTTNTPYIEPSTGLHWYYNGTTYLWYKELGVKDSTYYITPWYASQHFAPLVGNGYIINRFGSTTPQANAKIILNTDSIRTAGVIKTSNAVFDSLEFITHAPTGGGTSKKFWKITGGNSFTSTLLKNKLFVYNMNTLLVTHATLQFKTGGGAIAWNGTYNDSPAFMALDKDTATYKTQAYYIGGNLGKGYLGVMNNGSLDSFNWITDGHNAVQWDISGNVSLPTASGVFTTYQAKYNAARPLSSLDYMYQQKADSLYAPISVAGTVTNVSSPNTDIDVTTGTSTPVLTFNRGLTTLTNYYTSTASDARYAPIFSGTGYSKFASGSLSYVTAIPNADLANSAITLNGTSTSLGGTFTVTKNNTDTTSTGFATRLLLNNYAPKLNPLLVLPTADYYNSNTSLASAATPSSGNVVFGRAGINNIWGFKGSNGFVLSFSDAAITADRTLSAPNNGGGIYAGTFTTGAIPYAASTTTTTSLAIGAANTVIHGGTTPSYSAIVQADVTNGYVDKTTTQTGIAGDKSFTGIVSSSSWFQAGLFNVSDGTNTVGITSASLSTARTQILQNKDGTIALTSDIGIHGNSTTTGTATTAVTVSIGSTMANTNYFVGITPQDSLTAVNFYISAKTTTTFTVTFVTALTGSINFDYNVTP